MPAAFGHAALGVRAVACGHDFTLVLCADGTTVLSLGGNDFGQRGLGWPNAEGTAAMRAPPGGRLSAAGRPKEFHHIVFCTLTKQNEENLALSDFYTNLMILDYLSTDIIIEILNKLLSNIESLLSIGIRE